jgi:uncharacterized Rmd1/YagE family protein
MSLRKVKFMIILVEVNTSEGLVLYLVNKNMSMFSMFKACSVLRNPIYSVMSFKGEREREKNIHAVAYGSICTWHWDTASEVGHHILSI